MTMTLDFSMSILKIAVSQELFVWLMWNEKEANQLDTGPIIWPCPGFDHTHELDLGVSRSKLSIYENMDWNSLISGMRGPIDIKRKGCELIIPDNNRDFRVTMVGRWVDVVTDSDRGDFRSWRRRAVDIIYYSFTKSASRLTMIRRRQSIIKDDTTPYIVRGDGNVI